MFLENTHLFMATSIVFRHYTCRFCAYVYNVFASLRLYFIHGWKEFYHLKILITEVCRSKCICGAPTTTAINKFLTYCSLSGCGVPTCVASGHLSEKHDHLWLRFNRLISALSTREIDILYTFYSLWYQFKLCASPYVLFVRKNIITNFADGSNTARPLINRTFLYENGN